MKALILNSGMGNRMGALTKDNPKCLTHISPADTILSRQLKQLCDFGIKEAVITTGYNEKAIKDHCQALNLPLSITFVNNPKYDTTNYIYSIYCAREHLQGDILLLHGDLVFENLVLDRLIENKTSCMTTSSTAPLPQKDFKAVIDNNKIVKVGVEFFDKALAAQPFYKLYKTDWQIWLEGIIRFCEEGETNCYAEKALNEVSDKCHITPLDIEDLLCNEIDTPQDLEQISSRLREVQNRTVYMCFSTDILHSGHVNIIKKAAKIGSLTIGVLSDEAVASYKRYPLLPFDERKAIFENLQGVTRVIEQKELKYNDILRQLKPDFVVHGDDWRGGFQKTIRDEVLAELSSYGGKLIEYPYSHDEKFDKLEQAARLQLSIPDIRRGRLRRLLQMKKLISVIEAHNGLTGLIAEKTKVLKEGKTHQFDAMWVSSLCDSTAKGKPDIELVDMSSRLKTIDEIMEVTTKPIILDGDTGGLTEHFVYNVRTLERMGVSAIIIEDKIGLKKNSLFGTEVEQTQDSIENFCAKISAGKRAQRTKEFMIIARIESLILEKGMEDALERAFACVKAGADGIMIHSRRKSPDEIFEFVRKFRAKDTATPLVVVPTSFNTVTEDEFAQTGVNIVIYANQLIRSAFPAMQRCAATILEHSRAKEADDMCMPIKEILTLITEE